MSCQVQCLGGVRHHSKAHTDWPKTNILAFETDYKKRRFLELFFINTYGNVWTTGGLGLYDTLGWSLESGPFYISICKRNAQQKK